MGNLIIITLMAAGMLGVVKALGGIDFVLRCLTRHVSGSRGAQACIAVLTAIVNLCTANNTVAIITVGPISREICRRYGVAPRKAASPALTLPRASPNALYLTVPRHCLPPHLPA